MAGCDLGLRINTPSSIGLADVRMWAERRFVIGYLVWIISVCNLWGDFRHSYSRHWIGPLVHP